MGPMKPTVADSRTPNRLILRGPAGDLPPVTAEAAGSSPVVPTIFSNSCKTPSPSQLHKGCTTVREKCFSLDIPSLQELGQQLLSNQQPGLAKFLASVTPATGAVNCFNRTSGKLRSKNHVLLYPGILGLGIQTTGPKV
jgi:hypothetical protein